MVALLFCLFALVSAASCSCEPGTVGSLDGQHCYGAIETHMTFAEAQDQCGQYGTHISSIHAKQDNEQLKNLFDGIYWIGGTHKSGNWQWTDGSSFNYTNWAAGGSHHASGKDCIAVDGLTGLWISKECNAKMSFTCQFAQLPGTPSPAPTSDPSCPSGALCINSTAYSIAAAEFFDWPTAEKYCVDMFRGHLASIHSDQEYNAVYKYLYSYPRANEFFIGGQVNANGKIEWSDGTPFDFSHMMFHPTKVPQRQGECLAAGWLDLDAGRVDGWSFYPCQFDTELGALCKYSLV